MANRPKLRAHLSEAWGDTLKAYEERLINSEHALQVHFCIALAKRFEAGPDRRIFVEPKVKFSDAYCFPDLLIAGRDRIIAVVELKYTPRGKPSLEKDFGTLARFCDGDHEVMIINERYRGPAKAKSYPIADDAFLCWGAIYSGLNPLQLPVDQVEKMGKRFVRLDGRTMSDAGPISGSKRIANLEFNRTACTSRRST